MPGSSAGCVKWGADVARRVPLLRWVRQAETGKAAGSQPSWGDGFADDGWSDITRVQAWAECSPDEYIRIFPHLMPYDRSPDPHVMAHLARAVDAQSDPDVQIWLLRVLTAFRAGTTPPLEWMSTASFAFHAALHPAYIWPSALCTAERDMVAGWLGVLRAGRHAVMPREVAHYLLDLIVCDGSTMRMRDPDIQALIEPRTLPHLHHWAQQRLRGSAPVGRLRPRGWAGRRRLQAMAHGWFGGRAGAS